MAIVLGHVLSGLSTAQILDFHSAGYALAERLIYTFHLSAFAFLSGIFVRGGVTKAGPLRYIIGRDALFLWLYLLWYAIQLGVKVAAGPAGNHPVVLADSLRIWLPDSQLWFLPFLIAATTAAALIQPWRSVLRGALTLCAASGLAVAFWGTTGSTAFLQGGPLYLPFFIGVLLGAKRVLAVLNPARWAAAATVAVLSGTAYILIVAGTGATPPTIRAEDASAVTVALGAAASALGVTALLALSTAIARIPRIHWLARVGEESLPIFLGHVVFMAGARIVLDRIGVDSAAIQLAVGVLAGVVGPLALAALARRFGCGWLFALPAPLRRVVDRALPAPGHGLSTRSSPTQDR